MIRNAMREKDKAGVARIILSKRERMVLLEPHGKGVLATVLGCPYEIRPDEAFFESLRYTASVAKRARTGRIFVDYLRNGRGATAVAPYSTRARAGAPVSAPIGWDELASGIRPNQFNVETLPVRLRHFEPDLWVSIGKSRQSLGAATKWLTSAS